MRTLIDTNPRVSNGGHADLERPSQPTPNRQIPLLESDLSHWKQRPATAPNRQFLREAAATLAVVLAAILGLATVGSLVARAATPQSAAPLVAPTPEFLHAADEVLAQMSVILHLPIKEPLKKTLRSKQEIRAYLIRAEKEDKDDAQRYADQKALEAFQQGLPHAAGPRAPRNPSFRRRG